MAKLLNRMKYLMSSSYLTSADTVHSRLVQSDGAAGFAAANPPD